MDAGLKSRVVVVTGASSGIGRATALAFAREGARVVLTYRRREAAVLEVGEEIERLGAEALVVPLALEDSASVEEAFARIAATWGGVDVLVANAVAWPGRGMLETVDMQTWAESIQVNVAGTAGCLQAALPFMRERGWGRIVILSAGAAEEGLRGASPYTTAKAALHGLARTVAWEVGDAGILLNVVALGLTETERNLDHVPETVRQQIAARTPTGRLSRPDEVASLVLFLGSAANGNISGEIFHEGSSTGRSAHAA